jgi:hypothetical protein
MIVEHIVDLLTAELLLVLASTVILGSESNGTHDVILMSDGFRSLQSNSQSIW